MNSKEESEYRFEYQQEPIQEDEQILFEGINDEAVLKKKMERINPFGIFIKDTQGAVLGGVNRVTYYGCFYVDLLWVKEELGDQGFGKKLMIEAEKIGRERQCSFATVNTIDWEALTFYQMLGYEIEFVREGYVKESRMYMLRKNYEYCRYSI